MSKFSNRTISYLGDVLAGWFVVRKIQILFDDAQVELGPAEAGAQESSVRRGLMRQYLATLDLDKPRDTAQLCDVMTNVLDELRHRLPESQQALDRLTAYVRRDGFTVQEGSGRVMSGTALITDSVLSSLHDPSAVRDHLRRLGDTVDVDPRLAVSVAKDLVESTAKIVLTARRVPYSKGDGVPQLVSRAQESLGLAAKGASGETPQEEKALRSILGSLVTLTQGVTELRNQVGLGHGRESVPTWVRPRHARLAAGAAQVWCQLMLETLDDSEAPWRSS